MLDGNSGDVEKFPSSLWHCRRDNALPMARMFIG